MPNQTHQTRIDGTFSPVQLVILLVLAYVTALVWWAALSNHPVARQAQFVAGGWALPRWVR